MEVKIGPRSAEWPQSSPRRLFAKTADLHETLLLVVQTHIQPFPRALVSFPWGAQVAQKPFRRGVKKQIENRRHEVVKSTPKVVQRGADMEGFFDSFGVIGLV